VRHLILKSPFWVLRGCNLQCIACCPWCVQLLTKQPATSVREWETWKTVHTAQFGRSSSQVHPTPDIPNHPHNAATKRLRQLQLLNHDEKYPWHVQLQAMAQKQRLVISTVPQPRPPSLVNACRASQFACRLSVAVTFGSIAAGILGVSSAGHKRWGPDHGWLAIGSRLVGLAILAFSIALVIAASYSFYIRKERLRWAPLQPPALSPQRIDMIVHVVRGGVGRRIHP